MGDILNINIIDKNNYIVKVNSFYKYKDLDDILNRIKKLYYIDISGYYDVDIYEIKKFLTVIKFKKIDDDNYYKRTEYNIKKHYKEETIVVEDFTLIDKYNYKNKKIKGSEIDNKDIIRLCEHYTLENINLQ